MQFKSFLVPTLGRSNYYQGGNTINISGGNGGSFVPGGGGGYASTDYVICKRRTPGTEELTATEKNHNKEVYDKLLLLKGAPGNSSLFYLYGAGNVNLVKYNWIVETAKSAPETKGIDPPDIDRPERPDPDVKPDPTEKGDVISFTFIDKEADGIAYMYEGKLKADGQVYISTKSTVGGGKDFQPDINAINEALGTKEDKGTVDTAFGRIAKVQGESDDNWQYIYDVEQRLDSGDYAQMISSINQDLKTLGKPTDDGETIGQTETAFGRIAKLENGDRPSLITLAPVIQKNCFYIDAESNPDSKADNVTNYKNVLHWYQQDPLCSVPVVIRPNQDFNGVWPAINVIPQTRPGDAYKDFSSFLISFVKKDYEGDKKYWLWTYDFFKDGTVEYKEKRLLESDSKDYQTDIDKINAALGTYEDAASVATAFGRIKALEGTTTDLRTDLGNTGDASTANTAFGRIKATETAATDLRTDLGNKGDTSASDTAFGRIKSMDEEMGTNTDDPATSNTMWAEINRAYNLMDQTTEAWNQFGTDYNQLKGNVGKPTDDGISPGQTDTAFGRIKQLENGESGGLVTFSPIIQKNCFYIDAESNPDSKADNVTNFRNIKHWYQQDPLCSVPVVVRPNQDFNGVWPSINVIPQTRPGDAYKDFSSMIVSFVKKDYTVDEKFKIWTYDFHKDGTVTFIDKREIEGSGSTPTPQPVDVPEDYYIIKTKRDTNPTSIDTPIYTVIENIDSKIVDNPDYRICLLRWRRHNKEGNKWTIPMFCGEWYVTSGEWTSRHPDGLDTTTKYQWADTWWPIHYNYVGAIPESGVRWFSNPKSTKNTISSMEDLSIDTAYEFHNHNKKIRYGVAIFKRTGQGLKGWTRVSNIAEILIFAVPGTNAKPIIEVKN